MTKPKFPPSFHGKSRTTRFPVRLFIFLVGGVAILIFVRNTSSSTTTASTAKTSPEDHQRQVATRSDGDNDSTAWKGEVVLLQNETTTLRMPALGFGTCCRKSAKGKAIYQSVLLYLKNGGRLIDTAMAYDNHKEIGQAIIASGIPRNKIWITSKIAVGRVKHSPLDDTRKAIPTILQELQTTYLDLLLIHSPKLKREKTLQVWQAMIEARDIHNTVRAIGVSNFIQKEIEDLIETTGIRPQIHQIQFHPWIDPKWKQQVLVWQKQKSINIPTTAYTSLGGSRFHTAGGTTTTTKFPSFLTKMARNKYNCSEAQLLLRWALNHEGIAVIPGATSEQHIRENLNVPKFEFTPQELAQLETDNAPPIGWWDPQRGPNKFLDEELDRPWMGDHATGK